MLWVLLCAAGRQWRLFYWHHIWYQEGNDESSSQFLFRCFCFTWNASWFHTKKKNFLYKETAICTLCNCFLWILAGLSGILTQLILTNDLVTSLVLCALWTLFQQSIKWSSLLKTNHKPERILKRACCVFFIGENPSAGSDCGSHCSRSPA